MLVTPRVTLKTGQVLGLVGGLSGIQIEIEVPEVDIGTIKKNMNAIIRGVAFNKALHGKLTAITAQATNSNNTSLPSFKAIIEVRNLTQQEQKWIKIGMSAEIELNIENFDKLLIPLVAIKPQDGQNLVRVVAANHQIIERPVTTGMIAQDKIAIDVGLNAGEIVVYE